MRRHGGRAANCGRCAAVLCCAGVFFGEARSARADEPPSPSLPPLSPFSLSARVGPQSLYLEGDGAPADLRGFVFGADAALRVGRHLSIAGAFETSIYGERGDRVDPGPTATSYATFLVLRADTNPEGPFSLRIDLGTGARWLDDSLYDSDVQSSVHFVLDLSLAIRWSP